MTSTTATQPITTTTSALSAPSMRAPDLDAIATRFARHGVASVEADLRAVAAHARLRGVSAPSVDAMVDATAPQVVRARAFAHVARLLNRASIPTSADDLVTVA